MRYIPDNIRAKGELIKKGTGRLIVVGSGIKSTLQMTFEALKWVREADVVFCAVVQPAFEALRFIRPDAIDLSSYYGKEKARGESYTEMSDAIVAAVKEGKIVCAVFYGHPGFLVLPAHWAIDRVRKEGYSAQMLPGVSSLDCLFADLDVEPGRGGCQMYLANDMLLHNHRPSPTSHVVLMQINAVGMDTGDFGKAGKTHLLLNYLKQYYSENQACVLYRAATMESHSPLIKTVKLLQLTLEENAKFQTLYIPPQQTETDPERAKELGITWA